MIENGEVRQDYCNNEDFLLKLLHFLKWTESLGNMTIDKANSYKLEEEQLIEIITRSSDIIRGINLDSLCEEIDNIAQGFYTKTINVMVMGGICTGKSTVINALLGDEILPTNVLPCLPLITEIKYGESKKAVLHFCNSLPESLPLNVIPAKIHEHIQLHGMKNIPPLCIEFGEVESILLSTTGESSFELWNYPIINKLEIDVPLDRLKDGLTFIEMPGFYEINKYSSMINLMAKTDVILFVLGADHLCTMDEMTFIDNNLYSNGFNDPLFVINRCDLFSEKDIRKLREFAKIKLQEYSSKEVSCISALLAVEGNKHNDDTLYKESGMELLTAILSEQLDCDRKKRLLLQNARMLKRILNEDILNRTISKQLSIHNSSYEEIKKRYDILAYKIQKLKAGQDRITFMTHRLTNQLHSDMSNLVKEHVLSIEKEIPLWIEGYTPVNTLGIFPTQRRFVIITNEIVEVTSERILDANLAWFDTEIKPFVKKAIRDYIESVESELIFFYETIDSLSSHNTSQEKADRDFTSFWKKSLGAEVDEYVDKMSIPLWNETNEKKEYMIYRPLCIHPVPLFNPFFQIPMCIIGRRNGVKKLKDRISEEIVKYIDERLEDCSNQFAESFTHKIFEMEDRIIMTLSQDMNQMAMKQNSISDELKHSQSVINELRKILPRINNLCEELDAFMVNLTALS